MAESETEYWLRESGETVGPFKKAEAKVRAKLDTLVSFGQEWRKLEEHPDFGGTEPSAVCQYKVVEVKMKSMIKGRVTAVQLETKINEWAQHGWKLDRIVAGETASFLTGGKDVFLLIFRSQ